MALLFIVCLGSSLWPAFLCDLNSKDGTDRHKSCDVTLLESRLFQNVIAVIFTRPAFILRALRHCLQLNP